MNSEYDDYALLWICIVLSKTNVKSPIIEIAFT